MRRFTKHKEKLNKCIQCGKKTKNPSWCSSECVDIYEGEAPRRTGPYFEDKSCDSKYDLGTRHSGHPGYG